uniref:Secreted protein n=1 Tax=Plectus sambesii TaxID=2011161 RepID=A0A914XJL8_9BILA
MTKPIDLAVRSWPFVALTTRATVRGAALSGARSDWLMGGRMPALSDRRRRSIGFRHRTLLTRRTTSSSSSPRASSASSFVSYSPESAAEMNAAVRPL